MKITAALLTLLVLFLPNTYPQDYTQLNLPEGAVARLGNGFVKEVQYSPDGSRLVVVTSIGISLRDTTTYRELALLAGHTDSINHIAFSPDSAALASGSWDDTVRLWDTETGEQKQVLTGHWGIVTSVAFSPAGKVLASVSWDGTVLLWKIAD